MSLIRVSLGLGLVALYVVELRVYTIRVVPESPTREAEGLSTEAGLGTPGKVI